MHPDHSGPSGDPRIFENPLEASIELADLTEQRLPQLRKRSRSLLLFGASWTLGLVALATVTGLNLWDLLSAGSWPLIELAKLVSLLVVLVPSIGLGITLTLLSLQETRFLPHLDASARAIGALSSRPPGDFVGKAREKGTSEGKNGNTRPGARSDGAPIAGIVGSALKTGDLVTIVERMTSVARAVLYVVLLGLGYMVAVMFHGLLTGSYITLQLVLELLVFAVFVGPAFMLLAEVSRDQAFYRYYKRRHRALADVTALGVPPVPEGETHLERFDSFLKGAPGVRDMLAAKDGKAGVERNVGPDDFLFSRLYHGPVENEHTGILVKELERPPDIDMVHRLLDEAGMFGRERGLRISRVVALVTGDAEDVDDRVYEHIIEHGARTRPGECAIQLVMEVGGAYSMVPYVAL